LTFKEFFRHLLKLCFLHTCAVIIEKSFAFGLRAFSICLAHISFLQGKSLILQFVCCCAVQLLSLLNAAGLSRFGFLFVLIELLGCCSCCLFRWPQAEK